MPTIPALPTRLARIGLGNALDIVGLALVVAGLAGLVGQAMSTVFDAVGADVGIAFWDTLVFSWDRREPVLVAVIGLLALLLGQATVRSGRSIPSSLIRVVHWAALLIFGLALLAAVHTIVRSPIIDWSVGASLSHAVGQVALAAAGGLLAVVMLARPVRSLREPHPANSEDKEP